MNFFGFEIKRKETSSAVDSVIAPNSDDGSSLISTGASYYGYSLNMDTIASNENDLIKRYREISQIPEVDSAIEDIVNEAIVSDDESPAVQLNLDDLKVSDKIKKRIIEEFDEVLNLLKFDKRGHDFFRSWYVDGRIYFQMLVDEQKVQEGIQEIRFVDPTKIKKVKEIVKQKDRVSGVEVIKEVKEYFVYNEKGITNTTNQGVKLAKDSIIYVPSGVTDYNQGLVLGHLHKVIKVANQLKMVEDALVIYRLARAPERRVFYIDVGNLPKIKAEQYIRDIMNKYRNKLTYDVNTGEVKDDRKHLSMLEDFWMPRREGGKGTEITTLQGGQNLGQIEDVEYFKGKLYQALNVPLSRLQPQQGFSLGRSSEITREEIKFAKFILRLRQKFSEVMSDALRVQLILKRVITPEEWDDMMINIRFEFMKDNYFSELKENEILTQRIQMAQLMEPYVGKYYSMQYVRRNVLKQNDKEISEIDKEIKEEGSDVMLQQQQQAQMGGGQAPEAFQQPDEQPSTQTVYDPNDEEKQ
jgi:hypothetical protein